MEASARFSPEAIAELRREIEDAGGNEVFALGFCGEDGLVAKLRITARGNEGEVLALGVEGNLSGEPGESGECFDVFIHNHPSGPLTPSDNDLIIAGRAAENGIGAYIVDNPVERVYVVAEPVKRRERKELDAGLLCAALEEGGEVARRLPGYERRDAQLRLVRLVARAFNEDAVAAAEAGTGVGKSFAYLLPAIEFALANGERIVISTATITLQQQLYEKDLPLVLSALGKDVKRVLVKGRGNFLCRRRLAEALMEPPLDEGEFEELRALTAWTETTATGSRSDLSFMPSGALWSRLCSESETCLGMRCAERDRCFFLALRRESADARLLVVNHHLLFADLAARHEGAGYDSAVVLPPYTRVIIDEAHTIENAATSFFSKTWSRMGINRSLGRLYRRRRTLESGLLLRLASSLPGLGASGNPLGGIPGMVNRVREAAERADKAALARCGGEGIYRFTAGRDMEELRPPLEELRRTIAALAGETRTMTETADGEDPTVWEIRAILRRLESAAAICGAFLDFGQGEFPGDNEVFWLERQSGSRGEGRDSWVSFTVSPVDIAPSLKEALFEANKTVVCVSATLGAGGSGGNRHDSYDGNSYGENRYSGNSGGETAGAFRFWAARTGAAAANRPLLEGIFPSPFPYRERCLLAVPSDAPPPDSPHWEAFLGRAVTDLVTLSGGGALCLFTSYQTLETVWAAAAGALESGGIPCLRQGGDDRSRLLKRFLEDRNSVLFGTDSFWEGVDAPGETLRLVIICRLPFRTMKDPVFEARREALEKQGRSSFTELSLPDAVVKFKQGFGRLMRGSSDYGAVAVLDGRLLHKRYGEAFLAALPETRRSFRELSGVLDDLERFLY
ncbi:MAG: ATP-dependent DNA helicase DinG [Treponema sp.]|jgi:ATP-dependent DNA helicase DinG|nr:ATP-dependent DNA helicase DinG [Treponema sp.]